MPPSMLCRRGVMPQDTVWPVEPYQAVLQEVRSVASSCPVATSTVLARDDLSLL